MPTIQTDALSALLEAGAYRSLVVRRLNGVWFLLAVGHDGQTLIHANRDGTHKVYRHARQATDWLAERFGITSVTVEPHPEGASGHADA